MPPARRSTGAGLSGSPSASASLRASGAISTRRWPACGRSSARLRSVSIARSSRTARRSEAKILTASAISGHREVVTNSVAREQELERRLDATFRRVSACRQSLASISRHRHMMAGLAASDTHDDLEFEWIAFASSLDLDHPAPFRHLRTGPRQFDISYSPALAGGIECLDQIEIGQI